MEVVIWQLVVFATIFFSGTKRAWVSTAWIIWTIFQVYTLPLSVIQFGTIAIGYWVAGSLARGEPAVSSPVIVSSATPSIELEQEQQEEEEEEEEDNGQKSPKNQTESFDSIEVLQMTFGVLTGVLLLIAYNSEGDARRVLTGTALFCAFSGVALLARNIFR